MSRLAEAARQGTPIPPTHAPAAPARQLDAKEVAKAFGAGPEEEEDGDGNDVSSPIPLRFSPIPGASAAGADAGAAPATASPGRGGLFGFARFLSSPPKSAPGAMPTGGKLRPRPQHTTRSTQEYEQEQGQAPLMRPSATPIHVSIVPRSPARGGRGKGRTTTVKVAALVKTWGPLVAVVVVAWLLAWLLVAVRVEAAALGSRGDGQRAAGRGRSWRSLL